MKRETSGPCLSAVFVDYDNIYLSLKRKNEEAAKRFAKDAAVWIKAVETGALITPTSGHGVDIRRRIVMNRCYGNPVPRRNGRDNSTDMSSFPFVRHNFLRAGFEVVDCPPLTAQLKNSSDIRIVMDVRDFLTHETYFDEFIVLSGDSDFTPVLHRLRAHARRTVIFANEHTASPYTAICDGEIREQDLISLLMEGRISAEEPSLQPDDAFDTNEVRLEIISHVAGIVRTSDRAVPIEVLADRAQRALGHDRTIGTNWAGAGSFRALLSAELPGDVVLTEQAPYLAFDPARHGAEIDAARRAAANAMQTPAPAEAASAPQTTTPAQRATAPKRPSLSEQPIINLQQSLARIHEACKVPPLAPPEYRLLFEVIAAEIAENGPPSAKTIAGVAGRAKAAGLGVKTDDIRLALDVVSEADPWFEQGVSANLLAGRFRNYAVARCRSQGLNLTADELDLIDAWFAGGPVGSQMVQRGAAGEASAREAQADRWWQSEGQPATARGVALPAPAGEITASDLNMPRIVRSRLRG